MIETPRPYALPLALSMLMGATSAISEDILQVRTADVWMAWRACHLLRGKRSRSPRIDWLQQWEWQSEASCFLRGL